ncbi:MAG: hydantoinase/oxoprolinase family protein [Alphaproteobacteria bacterium]|nr:hydantoinase/oxoprolinase family protein [Alphaproteobacteria bacterium]
MPDSRGAAAPHMLVGVDVGGTFTDLISLDPATGGLRVAKVPTTSRDQSVGFMSGLEALELPIPAIDALVHGTTAGTNAILERKGAVCGLITTRGFRDSLELGRRTRPQLYGMVGVFEPLVAREFRLEVTERVDAQGRVVEKLNENEVAEAIRKLVEMGAETLLIHFIHSYANPVHEERCFEIAQALWPNRYITLGSRILREIREFERGTAAALNGYIQPVVGRYIERLSTGLKSHGLHNDLMVMQGNGGMMSARVVEDHAVHTVMSEPAAGAIAAAATGRQAGLPDLIGCDMGGTSFDVTLIRGGQPAISAEKDLDYAIPVRVPMIDIHSIGAGGGSIARVDRAGMLRVGPQSAGAYPGSICYGRGGEEPTVTDANLALGRVNAAAITGVSGPADVARVRAAIEAKIGKPLGLGAEDAAEAIVTVANHQMAAAVRLVSIERGYDPRDFAVFAFGGAGPLHAVAIARELSIPKVLVPRFPGITSALGCVIADVRHDFVRYVNRALDDMNAVETDAMFAEQRRQGEALLKSEAVATTAVDFVHEVDVLFQGQVHLFRIPVASPGFDATAVHADFVQRYDRRFNIRLDGMRASVASLRTTVLGRRRPLDLAMLTGAQSSARADAGEAGARRRVRFGAAWLDTPVLRREALKPDQSIPGPAIVEQLDTTVLIDPQSTGKVDRLGNIIITVS